MTSAHSGRLARGSCHSCRLCRKTALEHALLPYDAALSGSARATRRDDTAEQSAKEHDDDSAVSHMVYHACLDGSVGSCDVI